jgi:hypothetical protein
MNVKSGCSWYLAALLCMPATVFSASGWTEYAAIAELTPTIHGRFLVKLNATGNPSGCKDKQTFYQDYDIPGSEQMFRTLLEAVTSGKKVRLYVTGGCELNGYSEISSVSIVP